MRHTCQSKHYLACNSGPPEVAPKIVKILYVSFCNVAAKDCSNTILQQPKKEDKDGAKGPKKKSAGYKHSCSFHPLVLVVTTFVHDVSPSEAPAALCY